MAVQNCAGCRWLERLAKHASGICHAKHVTMSPIYYGDGQNCTQMIALNCPDAEPRPLTTVGSCVHATQIPVGGEVFECLECKQLFDRGAGGKCASCGFNSWTLAPDGTLTCAQCKAIRVVPAGTGMAVAVNGALKSIKKVKPAKRAPAGFDAFLK